MFCGLCFANVNVRVQEAPLTALHGPEVAPGPISGPLPSDGPVNGARVLAAVTDEKAKSIVLKYGFNLRGAEVRCHQSINSQAYTSLYPCACGATLPGVKVSNPRLMIVYLFLYTSVR